MHWMQTDENVKRLHLAGQKEANAALALAMLLRLKEYAVRAYGLQPDRVRAFLTATAEKRRLVRATACCSSRPASCLYLCARIGNVNANRFATQRLLWLNPGMKTGSHVMAQEDKANVSCSARVAFSLAQLPWDAAGRAHQAKHLHKASINRQ